MLSAVISSVYSYPAVPLAGQLVHQWYVQPGPLVLGSTLLNLPTPTEIGTELSHDVLNPARVPFKWRTAIPLGPASAPGCDEPTSRVQTSPSMWALGGDQPVIPGVPFILWAMVLSIQNHRITMTGFSSLIDL